METESNPQPGEPPAYSAAQIDPPMSLPAAFRLILALFFVWGFLTCLNDILLPQLKFIFSLSYAQAVAIQVTFFSTCFLFAPAAARLTGQLG
jgi:MFS transporter, FHS family, L-fucose permease